MGTGITTMNAGRRRVDGVLDLFTIGEPIVCLDALDGRLDDAASLSVAIGGAECNVAIGLARLGHRSAVAGRIGADAFGRGVCRRLRAEGVDTRCLIADDDAPTALLFKEHTYTGVDVHYRRSGCAGSRLGLADIDAEIVRSARVVHVTGVTASLGTGPFAAVQHVMRTARQANGRVSFDANFRHKLASERDLIEMFHALCPDADDVLLGWGEASTVAGDSSEESIRTMMKVLDRPCVVVKRPAGGAICLDDGEWLTHEIEPTTVVDPVGAGDGFATGFLHARLIGATTADGLALGAEIASRVVAMHGDNAALPYASELRTTRTGVRR